MLKDVLALLDSALGLDKRSLSFTEATPLMGSVPELDSIGVVSIITAIEERYGFVVDDDEIDGDIFMTVGSLVAFVASKAGKA